ncbi:MAG: glycosyltransferase [Methanobacteriaceae archaeon]|jgi:glycosyltransferase involved in cell wall biosynthesis/CDP-glycerol glycerophosphotransferase (TagB/SpsB family)|nr:glycosyltransferase [Methanobacteriaceae archaeon]
MSDNYISTIVYTHNNEKNIQRTLNSILKQKLQQIEVICINDNSNDDSIAILKEYASEYNNIKLINNKKYLGKNASYNNAIKIAKGEYISFIEGGDWISKDALEKFYYIAKQNDLDIVMCKTTLFDENNNNETNSLYYALRYFDDFHKLIFNHKDTKDFTCKIATTPFNKIYKKQFLLRNNIYFPENLDFSNEVFFYNTYLNAKKISLIKENLYYYDKTKIHDNFKNEDIIEISQLILEIFRKTDNLTFYDMLIYNRLIHLILQKFSFEPYKNKKHFYNRIKNYFNLDEFNKINTDLIDENLQDRFRKILNSKNYSEFQELNKNKEFSIIMPIYNTEKYLEESINSIIKQNFGFENNIELILVDNGSNDNSKEICLKYRKQYPENIKYLFQKHSRQSKARNLGLKNANGKYINFLNSDDKLKLDCLGKIHDFLNENKNNIIFVSIPISYFNKKNKNNKLKNRFNEDQIINIDEEPKNLQFSISSLFIERSKINDIKFNEELSCLDDVLFINQVLLNNPNYGILETSYECRIRDDDILLSENIYKKKEYYSNLIAFIENLIKINISNRSSISEFSKITILKIIENTLEQKNINNILNPEEINKLNKKITDVLSYIDDNLILDENILKSEYILAILKIKYPNLKIKPYNGFFNLYSKNKKILYELNDDFNKIFIDNIIINKNSMKIRFFNKSLSSSPDIINVVLNNKKNIDTNFIYSKHSKEKYLEKTLIYKNYYEFKLDIEDEKTSIEFNTSFNNETTCLYPINCFDIDKFNEYHFIFNNKELKISQIKNEYKVSVIIPVYNVEKYLKECLDSVLNQTLENIEILCINDGSTDSSLKILEEYSEKDERVKIFTKKNEGQGVARTLGIKLSKGEYIGFVDADDFIKKDMFEKLYNKAYKNDLDLLICKTSTYDEKTKEIDDDNWYHSLKCFNGFKKDIFDHNDTKEFTHHISVPPYNKIYKRNYILKNNIEFPPKLIFEDEVFFYEAYLKAKKISLLDDHLYYYRINRQGSTVVSSSEKDFSDVVEIFNLIIAKLIETKSIETYKKNVYNRFIHLSLWRYSQTSDKYKEKFWKKMKKTFTSILSFNKDEENILNINDLEIRVRQRAIKILKSDSYEDFKKLDSEKEFSIVMAIYNSEEYLKEAIDSVINQNFGFIHNVQLILVDDGSLDSSKEIALKYEEEYPENIIVLSKKNGGQASARNLGLKYVTGRYINFLDSDDKLSLNTLESTYNFLNEHPNIDIVTFPLVFFDNNKGDHPLNYKYKEKKVINLYKNPDNPQLSVSAAFILKKSFDGHEFNTKLVNSEDALLINKILVDKNKYGVLNDSTYFYRKRLSQSSTIDNSRNKKEFFIYRLKYFFKELIDYSIDKKGYVPKFIQYTLAYDLQWMVKVPEIDKILNENEINEFWLYFNEILNNIDDDVIRTHKSIDNNTKNYLLYKKNNDKQAKVSKNEVILSLDNKTIDTLGIHKIWLYIIEINKGFLNISGLLMSNFNSKNIKILAVKKFKNGKEEIIKSKKFNYPSRRPLKFLSENWAYPNDFDLKIPINKDEKNEISIKVVYEKNDDEKTTLELPIGFEKYAGLSDSSNYFINDSQIVLFKDNKFHTMKYSYSKMIKYEYSCLKKIFRNKESYYTSALFFRVIFLILYPFIRHKKIWLFMDRKNYADDNAEHLFKYSNNIKDNIKKYFIVSKDSNDYNRLKSSKNVIPYDSIRHKLLYLFSEKIISSHPDENIINPFYHKNLNIYSGLITSKKYFLQHGVTKDNISLWVRKYDKNLSLILTVSDLERESFLDDDYNYDADIIQTLGFPRFDNLKNENNKKQILFMPSWREKLQKNKNIFINSEYFLKINEFLNDENLINSMKKSGYKIIFKPHPNLYKFIDLFNIDENIIISYDKTYQELFAESSLLITDFSSVAFDFAYLNKPIIYYQFNKEYNFNLDKSYFDYEKMGFGEVIKNKDELLKIINSYLNNDCKMEEKYCKRVEKFFKFKDRNNCKRVYEWVFKY